MRNRTSYAVMNTCGQFRMCEHVNCTTNQIEAFADAGI